MASIPSDASCSHVVLFPFMAKGHTIPLLQFAQILLCRSTAVTVITTPANHQFIAELLNCTAASIVTLPFPIAADIPAGVESTDKLPSMSLFTKFGLATSAMQPHFAQLLETLPRVSFMVTDAFLWWTLHSAKKLGIPRLVFYGMSCYSYCLSMEAKSSGIFSGSQRDDELVALSRFPWIKLSKEYFTLNYRDPKPKSLEYIFSMEVSSSTYNSYGMLVNSFYELEPLFAANCNTQCDGSFRNWCVGPLCLAEQTPKKVHSEPGVKPRWVQWLDKKLEKKCWVLYVAFGTQTEISCKQLEEIAIGLEESKVSFLWVIRNKEWGLPYGFEEKVKGREIVVSEWVDQWEILMHKSVEGFVSYCGWNSVLKSICADVPIVAWPMMAEQYLNAKMVEEEMKVGLRVETCDGSMRGFVKQETLKKMVRELMEGAKGRKVREKVKELAQMAKKAAKEGGSSWSTLNSLLYETCI